MVVTTTELIDQVKLDYGDWGKLLNPIEFLETIETELSQNNFEESNSRLVFSVCPDDVNRLDSINTIENTLTNAYDGEFHLGGLGAYPMGGVSGLIAASHHPPDNIIDNKRTSGNLVLFISPHFGIIEKEEYVYGKIIRPGQEKITSSCGAMMGFLDALKEAGSTDAFEITADPQNVDPTRMTLHSALINNYSDWLETILVMEDTNDQVIDIFKLNYDLIIKKTQDMIKEFLSIEGDHFEGKIALIGGITVNTRSGDYFILKDISYPKE